MSPHRNYDPKPRYFNLGKEPIIGESVSLVDVLMDCSGQITIGDYVSFGHDCKLLPAKHDYKLKGKERQEISIVEPIVIKDGAWIASGVTICGGVTIGENAVIGACSLVLRDVPSNSFYAGVPARLVRWL